MALGAVSAFGRPGTTDVQRSLGTFRPLIDVVLTTDPVQRIRLAQAGLAMLLMAISVVAMHYVVHVGSAEQRPVTWWTLFAIGGLLLSYAAIRSGWSRRLADPALTVPQMVYAIACAAAAYAMAGPARGGVFPVLLVILMFGMFHLRPVITAWVSLYAVGLFGIVMMVMASRRPDVYPPEVELAHFLMVSTMLPAVSLLAGQLSAIRQRAHRQKKDLAAALARIQELATHDELTGLINRRHMVDLLEQERQRCVRSGHTFCIAMLDLDSFKRINDSHGHAGGDDVLRAFSNEAMAAIRAADVLSRWGGEQFVLLLTSTHVGLARVGMERLRERIAALDIDLGGVHCRLTVSAGLTEHRAGESVADALARADRALVDAKAQGRNRVVAG